MHYTDYNHGAAHLRGLLGVKRLNSEQANHVRAAVEKRRERCFNRPYTRQYWEAEFRYRQRQRVFSVKRKIEQIILQILQENYRIAHSKWAGGYTEIDLKFDSKPSADSRAVKVWSDNGKWSGTDVTFHLNIQPHWRRDILRVPGFADAGGLITTHATLVEENLWQASWVRQGRGYDVSIESGFIFRDEEGNFCYGKTAQSAKAVATRRRKAKSAEERMGDRLRNILTASELTKQFGDIVVRRSDSIRAGNCKEGTDNWIAVHFPDRASATVREILEVDSSDLVVRACKAAILRQSKLSEVA